MNKLLIKLVIVSGIFAMLSSCVKPEDPTNVQILKGEWEVENVIADGQVNFPESVFLANSILHLDRNDTYLFINVDGRANSGTWTADETTITLTSDDAGSSMTLNITYLNNDKLHAYYSFTNSETGTIEVRYLFRRIAQ